MFEEIDSAIAKYNAKKEKEKEWQASAEEKRRRSVAKIQLFLTEILQDKKVAELLEASDESIYFIRAGGRSEESVYVFFCDKLILSSLDAHNSSSYGIIERNAEILLQRVGDVEKVKEIYNAEIRRIIESAPSEE
jgi:hypothetical protein